MGMVKTLLYAILCSVFLDTPTATAEEVLEDTKILIMKPKLVEGELEKPAIIIVPRAKLLKEGLFRKSYYNDIVQDLYLTPFKDDHLFYKKKLRSASEK